MIPKIIHLTWFSGEEYPERIKKCLSTWKKVLPDFELKIWTMEMARSLNIPFVNEALDARKWAFAGDVVRAYAIWSEGGVYMDTDIYVLRRFDEYLKYPMVFFMEINDKRWKLSESFKLIDNYGRCVLKDEYVKGRQIQAAFFMGEKGQSCLKEILDYYCKSHFTINGEFVGMDLISPWIYAKILESHGFLYIDKDQFFENIRVFNSSYVGFSRYDYGDNTIALHLAEHAWDKRRGWSLIKYKIVSSRIGPLLIKLIRAN